MLIVCPNCQASYRVSEKSLGAGGRTVRCARCQTAWFADPDDAADEMTAGAGDTISEDTFEEPPRSAPLPPIMDVLPNFDPDAVDLSDDEPKKKKRRRASSTSRAPLWVAVFGLIAVAGLIVGRNEMVRLFPQTAALYAHAGLDVNIRGLAFRDVDASERVEGGTAILLVSGAIDNITDAAIEVPRLRLSVLNAAGRELYVWTVVPRRPALEARESMTFTAQLAAPPAEARDIAVRFLARHDAVTGLQ